MADEIQDTLDIIIADDPAPNKPAAKKEPKPADKKSESSQHPLVAEFRSQLDDLRRAKEAEAKLRTEAENEAKKARTERDETRASAISGAIATNKAGLTAAKDRLVAAWNAGEFEKAAEIQAEMAEIAASLKLLERDKVAADAAAKAPQEKESVKSAPAAPGNPHEDYINQFSPRSQTWLRKHPECVSDKALNQRMIGMHNVLCSEGYIPDTDAYFAAMDERMGFAQKREPDQADDDGDDGEDVAVRSAPPAAPTRTTPATSPRRMEVRLTAAERAAAEGMGMTLQAYAKAKLDLEKAREQR